jgi:hypothetical protein
MHLPVYSDFYNRLVVRSIDIHFHGIIQSILKHGRLSTVHSLLVPRHIHSARKLLQQSRDPLTFPHVVASQPITGRMIFVAEHAETCRGTSSSFVPIQCAATFVS